MNEKRGQIELNKSYIIGTCIGMCPEEETKRREREKLLHLFEIIPGTEKDLLPKADKTRTVKSFSRSAAGKSMQDPKNLRPPVVLLKTVSYLLDDIINRRDVRWRVVYEFIMDRLRSVRQDMIIQNISRAHQISILQPMVRFLVYASYRSCEESIYDFDPHLNNTHTQECLKRLLCMYDYYDELSKYGENLFQELLKERLYFEALYIIFNLGNTTAITRALNLPVDWRHTIVNTALEMSISYLNRNFVRIRRIIEELPPLLASVAYLHFPEMRRNCLKVMSVAYSCKNLVFPIAVLQNMLLYNNEDEVVSDCKYYGVKVDERGVSFSKNDVDIEKPRVNPKRSALIDQKLNGLNISTLILFGENCD